MDYLPHVLVSLLVIAASAKPSPGIGRTSSSAARVVNDEDYRLPGHTVPIHYDIKLIPYLEEGNFTFDGEVTISVSVLEPTSSIVLHASDLDIDDATVTVKSADVTWPISNQTHDSNLEFYTLTFDTDLLPGNYLISAEYTGTLADDTSGFYRNSYATASGETKWLAATQFEPTSARRAFPCFDEPALKAVFTVSIAHWPTQTAISNAAAVSTSTTDPVIENRVWTYFFPTPVMSTYLLAFVVSEFTYLSNENASFRVWSRPDALDTAAYALSVGERILTHLNSLAGYDYGKSLPKMDQVAIPEFSTGAMENWGLVIHRERLLLYKDGVTPTADKQSIATVIAHEFSHQWFGNLVSPLWWKYLWLNEGFATYFDNFATAGVETGWRLPEQFTVEYYHPALLTDSMDTTHPMNNDVHSPSQIGGMFDTITYAKAGSVVRMMQHFLGETVFQAGLRSYLKNMAYGAATPDDLWEALTSANTELGGPVLQEHVDIKTVMDTWTNQKGYPLVTVTRNYTSATLEIMQERFLLKGRGSSNDTTEYRWWIPINLASGNSLDFTSTAPSDWMRAQDESTMITGFSPSYWVICNVQQTGFYRVNYDDTNWGMISSHLQTPAYTLIHVLNRAQLIDDAFNLARAGYLKYSVALPVTRYLTEESSYAPWSAAFTGFSYLNTMLANSTGYADFKAHVLSLVTPIHETLGFQELESDEHVTKLLRVIVNSWVCRMGSTTCQEKAKELLLDYYSSANPSESTISADLKAWVYCEGLRNANGSVWNFLWERYLATDISTEQALILASLGCSEDPNILNNYLALSISANSSIPSEDTESVFTSVYSSSSNNVNVALNFLVDHYEAICESYSEMEPIGNILQGLAVRMVSDEQLQKLRKFVEEHRGVLGVAARSADRAIEVAEENLAWFTRYEFAIIEYLTHNQQEAMADFVVSGSARFSVSIILATVSVAIIKFM